VPSKSGRKLRLPVLVALLVGLVALAAVPRQADLTRFDPDKTARIETLMWRHYYDERYFALFADLYGLARDEQGFSPLDSARIAIAAARAARAFQPTTSRRDAQVAAPLLVDYFNVLARGAPEPVDVAAAARTELDWWQARRESVPPEDYGVTIARVATLLYGVEGIEVESFGVKRAQAMAYRDAHEGRMTEGDWSAIEQQLATAYRHLKLAVSHRTKIG
jgi:hypothetical protein